MYLLGLTGSVGMGKTTTANVFRRFGAAVYDADATVHQLMGSGGSALGLVKRVFPDVVKNNSIDRKALGLIVYNDKKALSDLELILHPLVQKAQARFLRQCAKSRKKLVVLDIPLLFENKIDRYFDAVAVVTAPEYVQKIRVLQRPEMTVKRFKQIVGHQWSDLEKRRRADFIIQTGLGRRYSLLCIRKIIELTKNHRGHYWPPQRVHKNA
jgi:dephospho-CoA kinase